MLRGGGERICESARRGLVAYERGEIDAAKLAKGLRDLADKLDPPALVLTPVLEEVDAKKRSRDVAVIFTVWVKEMGKDAQKAKLTKDRKAKIEARLKEGYSVDDITLAIRNCAASSFHRGDNDRGIAFDDLTLICRTGAKLEQFRDMGGASPLADVQPVVRYKETGW